MSNVALGNIVLLPIICRYFQTIIENDEKMFNKAIGSVAQPEDRENWQRQVELASRSLPALANN